MDEKTLNDLLECSVCLERLDTSSKVLPCQHTFCRKCLEVIVQSHQELRCPECRVLVSLKIDELPPNVLLMRILEGMKNSSNLHQITSTQSLPIMTESSQNLVNLQQNIVGNSLVGVGEGSILQNGYNYHLPHNTKLITHSQKIRDCLVRDKNELILRNCTTKLLLPHAKALYDFSSKESGDLNFKTGDIIILRKIIDHNWCYGEVHGREGAFPLNYVEIIKPLPLPQCKALYDFRMGPNEDEGCLSFKKGATIHVLRRVDPNWVEGRLGESIGIFPIAFVEMNTPARQLMDASAKFVQHNNSRIVPPTPFENVGSSDSSTVTSPSSNQSSNSSTTSSSPTSGQNLPTNEPPKSNQQSIKPTPHDNKDKRHSMTALIANNFTTNHAIPTNRHSMEILGPVMNNSENSNSNPSAVNSKPITTQQQRAKLVHMRFPYFPVRCEAIYSYKPQNADELELKKGSIYIVTERCEDGWLKGCNRTNKTGMFPGNYVIPVTWNRETQHPQRPMHSETNSGSTSLPGIVNHPKTGPNPSDQLLNRKPEKIHHTSHAKSEQTATTAHPVANSTEAKEKPKRETSAASSAVNLMKRLTNIKRSKSPTNSANFSIDNPVFEDSVPTPTVKHVLPASHPVHVRSGSCPTQLLHNFPIENNESHNKSGGEVSGSFLFGSKRIKPHAERPSLQEIKTNLETQNRMMPSSAGNHKTQNPQINLPNTSIEIQSTPSSSQNNTKISAVHRKSQSLDASTIAAQLNRTPKNKSHSHIRERFRCIVPYPPNSEYELELHIGDIVIVHKKRENGWYKGTHQRTGKTGLFPASFVEPDI